MKIELVSAVTENCLKDFLLMKKSLEINHDVNFNVACDSYCFDYLDRNFTNVECEQIITSNGADHVRGTESEKNDFIQIIKSKLGEDFKISLSKDLSLVAVQGPDSKNLIEKIIPGVNKLKFMFGGDFKLSLIHI